MQPKPTLNKAYTNLQQTLNKHYRNRKCTLNQKLYCKYTLNQP